MFCFNFKIVDVHESSGQKLNSSKKDNNRRRTISNLQQKPYFTKTGGEIIEKGPYHIFFFDLACFK